MEKSTASPQLFWLHSFYTKVGIVFWICSVMMILGGALQMYSGFQRYEAEAPIEIAANYGAAVGGGNASSFADHHGAEDFVEGIMWVFAGLTLLAVNTWLKVKSIQFRRLPICDRHFLVS